ncbi:hypothetical protein UC8_42900 [Roseimaritima ulvae]|uniref:Uncharacterized protein n=1 Tax=Roseimaritima ulvae TaxID=980254 RepID=A0A5B9QYM2_9BACT|nr:hypothetical protein UC8_42900 [Roseimaritima ulvae]
MLTKREICRLVVGLSEVNDADLLDDDTSLPADVCAADDRIAVRHIRDLVHELYHDFDYLTSPLFATATQDKSLPYCDMLAKRHCDPARRTEGRRTYGVALCSILDDNEAYDLTSPANHRLLDELRLKINALANPSSG